MCKCIKCGRTFAMMFVAFILGQEHRICAMYPDCGTGLDQRMSLVDALVNSKTSAPLNPVVL